MSRKYWVARHKVEKWGAEHKRIIRLLDSNGYCITWGGSFIGGKWDGEAYYLLGESLVAHENSRFAIVASSLAKLKGAAKFLSIQLGEVSQVGPRAPR